MTMTTTAKLRKAASQVQGPERAGKLYVWLHTNHDAIQDARAQGCGWARIAEIAIEDDAVTGASCADIKRLRRKWQRVCAAKIKAELRRAEATALKDAKRAAAASKPIMPSRLSPDWRPTFVDRRDVDQGIAPSPTTVKPTTVHADIARDGQEARQRSRADEVIERLLEDLRRRDNARRGYLGD
ncbi:hypothetical protein [Kozakia baliensis]|uniref:hypothetical protein n=1 Tax=Kozakia baliensis TaxID=153496 RepID=UPI00049703E7|nr:hypothetical protein [Kozakia baliensis]